MMSKNWHLNPIWNNVKFLLWTANEGRWFTAVELNFLSFYDKQIFLIASWFMFQQLITWSEFVSIEIIHKGPLYIVINTHIVIMAAGGGFSGYGRKWHFHNKRLIFLSKIVKHYKLYVVSIFNFLLFCSCSNTRDSRCDTYIASN